MQADPDRMHEMVNRLQEITGVDDDTWMLAEARRITWLVSRDLVKPSQRTKSLTRAQQLMERVRSRRPAFLTVLLLQSDIQRLNGENDAALETLKAAHKLQKSNPRVIRQIGC